MNLLIFSINKRCIYNANQMENEGVRGDLETKKLWLESINLKLQKVQEHNMQLETILKDIQKEQEKGK